MSRLTKWEVFRKLKEDLIVWKELADELKCLRRLIIAIHCDPRYQGIMSKMLYNACFIRAEEQIYKQNGICGTRMSLTYPPEETDIFHGDGDKKYTDRIEEMRKIAKGQQ